MKTSRRLFLKRTGLAAAVITPFLRRLEVFAQTAPAPKRLLIFATPNGTVMDEFWPTTSTYKRILAPLQTLQPKINVIRGVDSKAAKKANTNGFPDHLPDYPTLLSGRVPLGSGYSDIKMSGLSIDQHVANAFTGKTAIKSLQLGVVATYGAHPLIGGGAGVTILPELSPYVAHSDIFRDFTPSTTTSPIVDEAALRLKNDRLSVLNQVMEEIRDVRCALGTSDRQTFDAHLDAIADVERELRYQPDPLTPGMTSACTKPTLESGVNVYSASNFPKLATMMLDLAAVAFACDRTRVISFQMHQGGSKLAHGWVPAKLTASHHGISHNSEGVKDLGVTSDTRREWLLQIEEWFARQFAYLLSKLDAIPDGTGKTMLDNTLCVWVHEQSDGGTHKRDDLPVVTAGGLGGYFTTGRNINVAGRSMNDVLITLANAMGAPVSTFGDAEFCTGPISLLRA